MISVSKVWSADQSGTLSNLISVQKVWIADQSGTLSSLISVQYMKSNVCDRLGMTYEGYRDDNTPTASLEMIEERKTFVP